MFSETLRGFENNPIIVDGKEQRLSDYHNLSGIVEKLKPGHFLVFATGADKVPGCGWQTKPQICFEHFDNMKAEEQSSMFTASTCSLSVTMPVTAYTENLQSFMFAFVLTMAHGATFSHF